MKRLRTAKGRKVSSTRWLERQLNDPYVRRAKAENYRSRAAYKLLELDERFGLLRGVKTVVDLGIAPGGWSQVVRRKSPQARVVGIDLLPTDPIEGVAILELDFMDDAAPDRLKETLKDRVKDVRVTTRLVDSPACLVVQDGGMSTQLARMLKQAGQKVPDIKPVLEVNAGHALVKKLEGSDHFDDLAHILFDQALLAEGGLPEDPAAYVKRVNALLA